VQQGSSAKRVVCRTIRRGGASLGTYAYAAAVVANFLVFSERTTSIISIASVVCPRLHELQNVNDFDRFDGSATSGR
jgi:hypothetical protein